MQVVVDSPIVDKFCYGIVIGLQVTHPIHFGHVGMVQLPGNQISSQFPMGNPINFSHLGVDFLEEFPPSIGTVGVLHLLRWKNFNLNDT